MWHYACAPSISRRSNTMKLSATEREMTQTIRNKSWAELEVGDKAAIERTCAVQDLILFAHVSGNTNPMMLPDGSANHG